MNDNAFRFFLVDNVQHVLRSERLEIKSVGNVKVGRNCFRIVVYDNRFVTGFAQSPNGMDGAIIKLNALPDTNRTGTEYDNLFLVADFRLIDFRAESRVVVRSVSLKFCGASVNHFVNRHDVCVQSHFANFVYGLAGNFRD